jgi:hypothetical protein
MDSGLVGSEYASHFTENDIRLLDEVARTVAGADAGEAGRGAGSWRRDPAVLEAVLRDPGLSGTVLGRTEGENGAQAPPASPFLVFAVAVHRAAAELASLRHVAERAGPRQRVPVFDARELSDFLATAQRRLFLAELLASFTRIASGRYQVRARGEVRTRRFSELDPVRLAGLLDAVPEEDRPGVYRRLGDVALFLTGVYPDYAASQALGLVGAARLVRAAGVPVPDAERLSSAPALELLEQLGARWYRAAWQLAQVRTARLTVVAEVAARFRQARRVLNHVADRYLYPAGSPWFTQPET